MSRSDQLSMYATTISERNGNTCITYHSTVIVEFDFECIILRTGGCRTVTTKRKMNQVSRQFNLGYSVVQKNYDWWVTYKGDHLPFLGDTFTIQRSNVA